MRAKTLNHLLEIIDSETDECVEWKMAKDGGGYGHLAISGIFFRVHRFVWEAMVGKIPNGRMVCHRCDNPPCANIRHLFLGTHQDNMIDMKSKGRQGNHRFAKPWNRGCGHGLCRLTENQISGIRSDRATGMTFKAIGEKYGIAAPTAHGIVIYKRHKLPSMYLQ